MDSFISSFTLGDNTASPTVHVIWFIPLAIKCSNTSSFSSKDKLGILLNPKQYLHP